MAMGYPIRAAMILALGVGLGCGGSQHPDPVPAGGGDGQAGEPAGEGAAAASGGGGGEMVPPEKLDEIHRGLDRKRAIVSRCLAIAIDNKELPKNSRGKVTLEIVISPAGRAESVKVVRTTLESKMLADCVIGHVQEIVFPQLPKPYETSYTYGFEAM
jgi:hypothetical protein